MQGVPIKFRGKDEDGKYIYGDYVTRQDGCAIRFKEKKTLIKIYVYEVTVKPETVAQLVGYDADGKEVYTGDRLLSLDNDTLTAACFSNADYKYYRIMKGNADE